MQKFKQNLEYFLVEGWYNQTSGLYGDRFYGAYCIPSQPLCPIRCVLEGRDAELASQRAATQSSCVLSCELREEVKADGEQFDDERPPLSHTKFQGLEITIENPAGTTRSGVSKNGHAWEIRMKYDYGFLKRVNGADGEGVDVYVGPLTDAVNAYVVHQNNPETGQYDEDKVMLGFPDGDTAKLAYLKHYDNPDFFGSMTEIPMETFKETVNSKSDEFKWKNKGPQVGVKIEEMVGCGGIADRPNVLVDNTRPRRKKKPKFPASRNNRIGARVPTISQSGGQLGGNNQ